MNAGLSNIVEFPAVDANLQSSAKDENLSVIILTVAGRDESVIRQILDDTCQHKARVISSNIDDLLEVCDEQKLSLVLMRDLILRKKPHCLEVVLEKIPDHTSILVLSDEIDEEESNKYLAAGARDVVSLENPSHLRSVVMREIGNLLVRKALVRAQSVSSNYRLQVKRLTHSLAQGIADVRQGSIVGANRAWLKLFGCNGVEQILNTPFLDLVNHPHRAKVKQTLAERQSNKRRGDVLKISGRSLDGTEIPLNMTLERVRISGLSTIRITAWPDSGSANGQGTSLDAATQIYDRTGFLRQLEKQLSSPLAGGVRALAYIRPDRFSQVQESIGFLGSEKVLAHLAGILGDLAHPADLYGRFGGTVFTILLERGRMEDVEAWLRHFCKMVADSPFDREGTTVELSCTAGVCQVADSTMTIEKLLQEAHDACHQGRLRGGGEVCLAASTKATRNDQKHALEEANRIRSALRKNRFKLVRSPIAKLDDSSCKLRDTWVRMVADDGELILPGDFMPIAESYKLMTMIDRWVIAASLSYCAKGAPDLVFVQLSPDSVVDDTLGRWLQSILEKPGAKSSQICFQTTEANASNFLKQTIKQAKALIKMGFRFAVDQLGTTPDTLDILQNVPMQFARIDAALMQGVARDRSVEQEVAEIVSAAKERGIQTIGNRIEDATTMAAACKIGIDYAQGDFVRHDPIVLEDTDTMCVPDL